MHIRLLPPNSITGGSNTLDAHHQLLACINNANNNISINASNV